MKKFNALFFAMALVAVVVFASLASAATFVGIDKDGNVEKITVDPTKSAGSRISYESVSSVGNLAPALNTPAKAMVGHKFFAYEGGIVAISTDVTGSALSANDRVSFFKVNNDGTVEFVKNVSTPSLSTIGTKYGVQPTDRSGVVAVTSLNGDPVFVANGVLSTISTNNWVLDATKFLSFDISVDTAFVVNSKLYVIDSNDGGTKAAEKQTIKQVSKITTSFVSDLADASGALKGEAMPWSGDVTHGAIKNAVDGEFVYVATEKGLYKFPMKEITDTGIILKSDAPTVTKVNGNKYLALTAVNSTLYALKEDTEALHIVTIKDDTETTLYKMVSDDVKGQLTVAAACSFDIYAGSDNVIAVVNHGVKSAFYALTDDTCKLIDEMSDVYPSLAIVQAASTTPDTPDTPATSTVVDASKITDTTEVANLTKASGAAGTSAFVAQSDVTESTGTAPSTDTQTAVKEKAGFDNSTVAAVKDYTLAKKGYVLVTTNPGYNAANVKVYFVKKAASSSASVAAAEESFTASLLDSSYAAISTGTSAYATSTSELEAGDYTLVTVTKTASGEGEGEGESGSTTSSSSGGCNAGFAAVSALLALAFFKKSR